MHALAIEASNDVIAKIILNEMLIEMGEPKGEGGAWRGTKLKPETASFEDYRSRVLGGEIDPLVRVYLVRQFFEQTRFPLEQRLACLASCLQHHNNLMLVNAACALMDREAHLGKPFTSADEYLGWYQNWVTTNKARPK
jgi:hypothetical protein